MKNLFLKSLFIFIIVLLSCDKDVKEIPANCEKATDCETTTDYYGKMNMLHYDYNPLEDNPHQPYECESICWNNAYPFEIGSLGSGNCGEGFENVSNPYLAVEISLREYTIDTTSPVYSTLADRVILIEIPFECNDFSTQERFYNLIEERSYSFAKYNHEFKTFLIKYLVWDRKNNSILEEYSSLNTENTKYRIEVSEIIKNKPSIDVEPNGNGHPASIDLTLTFSCLLKNDTEDYILMKDAKVRGRIYRQHPYKYWWDDWGKGWDM